MLQRILNELETSPGGISINELGHRLGVERGALEGMLDYLVRKGRLQDDKAAAAMICSIGGCASCPGAHRASSVRASLAKALTDQDVPATRVKELIEAGFNILEKAAQEIPED